MTSEELNALSKRVIGAALVVHTELGPGLLESAYCACLKYELEKRGMKVQVEVPVPVVYDGHKLVDVGFRMDFLVDGELVIEVKSLEGIAPVHRAQLLSYLITFEPATWVVAQLQRGTLARRDLEAGQPAVKTKD